jgi:hypothetical protein
MFIMQGNQVKLVRYIISYMEHENEMQEMCVNDEHKEEIETLLASKGTDFTSQAVDQSQNEWFDGLTFKSFDEARGVFEAGEQAYLQRQAIQQATDSLRLRADIDYIAIMAGVTMA